MAHEKDKVKDDLIQELTQELKRLNTLPVDQKPRGLIHIKKHEEKKKRTARKLKMERQKAGSLPPDKKTRMHKEMDERNRLKRKKRSK